MISAVSENILLFIAFILFAITVIWLTRLVRKKYLDLKSRRIIEKRNKIRKYIQQTHYDIFNSPEFINSAFNNDEQSQNGTRYTILNPINSENEEENFIKGNTIKLFSTLKESELQK